MLLVKKYFLIVHPIILSDFGVSKLDISDSRMSDFEKSITYSNITPDKPFNFVPNSTFKSMGCRDTILPDSVIVATFNKTREQIETGTKSWSVYDLDDCSLTEIYLYSFYIQTQILHQ